MRVVLFAGGEEPDVDFCRRQVGPGDRVVCADGGYLLARRAGVAADLVVGDLDSLPRGRLGVGRRVHLLESYHPGARWGVSLCGWAGAARLEEGPATCSRCRRHLQTLPVRRHPPAKEASDLELALREARAMGAGEVLILGAFGGRVDHLLFNLVGCLALARELGLKARARSSQAEAFQVWDRATLEGRQGWRCSILSLEAESRGVTLEGFLYGLQGETLCRASTRGLSNLVQAERATVSLESGLLLVVLSPPED